MMNSSLEILWQKYASKTATQAEMEELFALLNDANSDEDSEEILIEQLYKGEPAGSWNTGYWDEVINNIIESSPSQAVPIHRIHFLRKWGWVAASIIVFIGIGAYLWTTNKKSTPSDTAAAKITNIPPGKEGAVLTLADGTSVVLDNRGNEVVANQHGSKVLLKNGQLVYDPTGETAGETVYNTMSVPKGRQFHMTLPDGTQVWLNSASSIRYPTVFAGKERKVDISGEAYFEVAKNKRMPFRLNINNKAEVEVLGTHFNVNAYDNEETINTTLMEGSVRVKMMSVQVSSSQVTTYQEPTILKPGQQAQMGVRQKTGAGKGSKIQVIDNVDIEKVMAWKNGLFNFKNVTLEELMRQLERWYDIEVIYENGIPHVELMGKITRGVTLNELLTALRDLGVRYRLEGRRLIILP